MEAALITSLVLAVAGPLLDLLEKGAVSRLTETTPIQRAAKLTGESFPEVEGLEQTLLGWCDDASFHELISHFRDGKRDAADQESVIAGLFIEASRFHCGDETIPKAREIVQRFFQVLSNELLSSREGVPLLAARGEEVRAEILASIEQHGDRVITEVTSAMGQVAADLPASASPISGESVEEEAFARQLDVARDLIREGKPRSAADLLAHVEAEASGSELSAESRFRLALNSGSAALETGDRREALRRYERALEIKPRDVRALCAASKAHLVLDETAEALRLAEEALNEDPTSVNALAMRLLALHHLGRDAEMEQAIGESATLLDSPLGSAVLGELRLGQGRFGEAVDLLRAGLASDEVHLPRMRMLLAVALVNTVTRQSELADEPSRDEDENRATLVEADTFFSRALEDMTSSEDRKTYLDTLASRAGVRALLGDRAAAMEDCDRVLGESPTNLLGLENKARLLLLLGDGDGTIELVERMPEPLSPYLVLLKAGALLKTNRTNEVFPLLDPLWDASTDDGLQIQVADFLLKAEAQFGTSTRSAGILDRLSEDWPAHPLALAARAEAAERAGNSDEGVRLFKLAIESASPRLATALSYDLAGMLYGEGDFAGAVAAYREGGVPSLNHPEYHNYLAALLRAGHLGEVLQLSAEARKQMGISSLAEIEAHVLEVIGDWPGAEALLQELSARPDSSVVVRLRLLSVRLRMGKTAEAREALDLIGLDEVWDDPSHLLDIAETRLILELPDALELAFRARRIGFDSPTIHKRYVTIFINREKIDDELLHPENAQVGSTVYLRRNDEEIALTILDDEDATRSRGEIGPHDELSSRLMGLTVGGQLMLGEGPAAAQYLVERIQSKHVHAFQETLLRFPIWFPEDKDLLRVEVRENDLSNLLLMIDERHRLTEQVMELYRTRPVTLGMVAELLGRSVIDVWTGLVGIEGERLLASVGNEDEAQHHAAILDKSRELTLDLVAIMTFAHLRLLDQLASAFDLVVPQTCVTELRLHHARNFEGAVPSASLGKQGGQYTHDEFTPEAIERASNFIKGILKLIEEKTEVAPATAALDLPPGEYAKLQETLGASSADAILVSKKRGTPLLSDDLRLRQLALSTADVDGVWTKPVLDRLESASAISHPEYLQGLQSLFLSNYRHPRISAGEIVEILEAGGFELTPEAHALLRATLGIDYDEQSVISVAAELMVSLFREPLMPQRVEALLGAVLSWTVLARANPRGQLGAIAQALNIRLRLDPLGLSQLLDLMKAWAAAHYLI